MANCYDKNMEAFERLLGNQQFQDVVMSIMTKDFTEFFPSIKRKTDCAREEKNLDLPEKALRRSKL